MLNKIIDLITSLDIFGRNSNFRFKGHQSFKTKTGVVFTILGLTVFLVFYYMIMSSFRRFPIDSSFEFKEIRDNSETLSGKGSFNGHMLCWFYKGRHNISSPYDDNYDHIKFEDLEKYIHINKCILNEYEIDPVSKQRKITSFGCKLEKINSTMQETYKKSQIFRNRREEYDTGIPLMLSKGKEISPEASYFNNFVVLKIRPCQVSDNPKCVLTKAVRTNIFMLIRNVDINSNKNDVMKFAIQQKRKGTLPVGGSDEKNLTSPQKMTRINFSHYGEQPKAYIFLENKIKYYIINPLSLHGKEITHLLAGSEVVYYDKYNVNKEYNSGGAFIFVRIGIKQRIVCLHKLMKDRGESIAGFMSVLSFVIFLVYGSYNTNRLEHAMLGEMAKDSDLNEIVDFRTQNFFSFYINNPSYIVGYHFDYQSPQNDYPTKKIVTKKVKKSKKIEEQKKDLLRLAIEVIYNDALRMGKIITNCVLFDSFKNCFIDKEVERLLLVATIGQELEKVKEAERDGWLDDLSLFGFTQRKTTTSIQSSVIKKKIAFSLEQSLVDFKS